MLAGSYTEKLKHFAQAIKINTDLLILAPFYLEAAIHNRLVAYLDELARAHHRTSLDGDNHSPRDALNCPKRFVDLLSKPEHWHQVSRAFNSYLSSIMKSPCSGAGV